MNRVAVEVRYFAGCPNAAAAVALVRECVAHLGIGAEITEAEGDYPSPSVLVNGRDVMGDPGTVGRACRRDLPTQECVLRALSAARYEVGE